MNKSLTESEQLQKAILMRRLQKRLQAGDAVAAAAAIPRADRGQPLPLSSAQQRLWFVDRLDAAAGAAYHMPAGLQLSGRLDKAALQRALAAIVARHEVLRTRFAEHDGRPVQVVDDAGAFVLAELDLRGLPAAERADTVAGLAEAEAARPFDLRTGPLLRGCLLALADDEHVLLLTQHHIVSDGWSVGVLVRELSQLYSAFCADRPDPLPPLPIQYADYAAWQRAQAGGEALQADVAYWRQQLAGAPELLAMPTDRPRPAQQSYRGDAVGFVLPASLSAALRTLSQQHGTTLFMTLLAGWSLLLARFSGQDDVVVGTPVANRDRAELEPLIGFFVNTLALRVGFADDPTVAELLARVRATTLAAYDRQALPFDAIVDALRPGRSLAHAPLFQALLSLDNTPGTGEFELPGLRLRPLEPRYATAQFDLTLSLTDRGEAIFGTLRYASDLFDAATMQRLLQHFEVLLSALVAQPDRRVGELALLDAGQRQALMERFHPEPQAFAADVPMHQRFAAQAAARPGAIALSCGGRSLSYGELELRANRLAHRLLALGVQPDDRVALCVERGFDLVVGALAILKAGAGYVPLDPAYPADRLAFALADSAPVALLSQRALAGTLPAAGCPLLCVDDDVDDDAPAHAPDVVVAPQHLAYVIYTSGSTGLPKGVMVEHRNVARLFTATDAWFDFGAGDVWTLFHSFAFDFSVWELWGALAYGGRLVIVPYAVSRSPADFHALLCAEGVTVLNQTPSAFRALVAAQGEAPAAHALRCVVFGGEALDPTMLRPWFARDVNAATRLVNMYGITETTVHVTYREITAADAAHPGRSPIGVAIPDLQLYLLDRHRQPVPLGVAGELYVGGAGVARGYLNRPELTAERFLADPFRAGGRLYRTGDVARRLADGSIDYLGRSDFQVKIRGFRIELGEIEARLAAHPAVRDAVVLAREDSPGDKRLVAYVTLTDPGAVPGADALRAHVLAQLPDYMAPAAYLVLAALPLTGNGKLDRNALPAPDSESFARAAYRAPGSDAEAALCRIWADVLGLEQVGIDDNYFDVGGDSIRSIAVVAQARQAGLDLAVVDLFRAPTVAGLAAVLAARAPTVAADAIELLSAADRALLPDGVVDAYPLTMLQQGMVFHAALDQDSGLYHDVSSNRLALPEWRPAAMTAALDALAERHPVLRTAFDLRRYSEPLQLVHARAALPMTVIDVTDLDEAAQDAAIAAFIDGERRTAFDLASAPLLRVFVHVRGPQAIQFTISFHHAILDGWSVASLQTELSAAYAARLRGDAAAVPALALGPDCAVAGERAALADPAQRGFWRDYLDGHAPVVLPAADGDVDAGLHRGRGWRLDPAQSRRLQALAGELGVPLRSVLLAAHLRVMALFAGGDDVGTGLVCNVRPEQAQGEQVLGLFLNTLPLRQTLAGGSWAALIADTYRNELQVMAHRRYPYFQLQLDNGRRSLFDVIFNFTNFHVYDGLALAADDGGSLSFESTGYGLDVNFDFHPQRGILLELTPGKLSAAQTERLLGYYRAALAAIAADPQSDYRGVSLLGAEERTRQLQDFNPAARDFGAFVPAHRQFAARAAAQPQAPALVAGAQTLSYAELDARADRLARLLRARFALRAGDRVALCLERGSAMVVAMLAVLKAGAAYVPVDPQSPPQRLRFLLADSAPVAVLTQQSLAARIGDGVPCLPLDAADTVAALAAGDDAGRDDVAVAAGDLAYVIYTSGSTGQPKGVLVEHGNLANLVHAHAQLTALAPTDRVLQFASFAFDVAVGDVFATLAAGACLVLRADATPVADAGFVALLERERISVADLPTAFWQQWTTSAVADAPLPALRLLLVGGEKAEADTLRRWFALPSRRHVGWINAYGPTETTVTATAQAYAADAILPASGLPIGRPLANTTVYVLDGDGRLLPTGAVGEIHIGGAGVARGYLGRDALTAERFVADPFAGRPGARMYRSGDRGRWRGDGSLEFVERADDQVKLRGFRIELGEIESQLRACAGVADARVVLADDGRGGRRLVAYFTSGERVAPSASELRAQLGQVLADYMLPAAYVALPALPLTTSGKVDVRALPAPDDAALATRAFVAPEGELECTLAGLWQALLGVERIGRDDQFFELGGHSLLVVRLIEQVRHAGYRLDVTQVFAAPTLRAMAAAIAAADADAPAPVVPANRIPAGCTRLTADMLPLVELPQAALDALVAGIPGGAGNVQDLYPLGPAQQGILFHHLLQPEQDAYLLRTALAFADRERLDAFVAALHAIVRRHDILRTTLRWDGLPAAVQVVLREVDLEVVEHALAADGAAEARFLALTEPRVQRMPLAAGALLALHVARNPDNGEWLLALMHHHVVCDHVTIEIMMAELQAFLHGRADALPPSLPYRNFIAQTLSVPPAEHEAYFRRVLAGIDEPTAPFDVLDVRGDGAAVEEVYLDVEPALAAALRDCGRRLGVTPAVLFHAAAAVVVGRCSGREDVVFGTVASGRLQGSEGAASQVLGMFINTLPMRVALEGRSVAALVAETQAALAGMLRHEQAPLAMAQRCSGVAASMPLFTTLFNYRHSQDAAPEGADDGWAGIRILANDERTNYPITLNVDDFGRAFGISAQCVRGIDPRRVAGYLHAALAALVAALETRPDAAVATLAILDDGERARLRSMAGEGRAFADDGFVHRRFEALAAARPDAIALTFAGEALAYGELNHRANQLAHRLLALGVMPDDRVALCVERGFDLVIGALAILKAGAGYVPLDPAYPADRLAFALADSAPVALLTQSALRDGLPATAATVLLVDADHGAMPAHDPRPALAPQHLAYVIYTSGSTGLPKGVMVEHRNVARLFTATDAWFDFGAGDVWTLFHSFAFDFSVWELWGALAYGGRLVIVPYAVSRSPADFHALLCAEGVTVLNQTPSAFRALVAAQGEAPAAHALRCVVFGGEALDPTMLRPWFARDVNAATRLVNMYGITETTVHVTFREIGAADAGLAGRSPIGVAIPDLSLHLLDRHGQPVPLGVTGELYVGGAGVARGYLNRAELTAERFLADPFADGGRLYRTGDLGRRLADGSIDYLGRSDFQVKIRGFRIELGEIEARLAAHPAVRDAVVLAREDSPGDKRLVAYVTLAGDAAPGAEELRAHLLLTLPDYMAPAAYLVLETLPLTGNGKLDRRALPAPDSESFARAAYRPPSTDAETALCRIWADVLGLDRVGVDDNYFDVGGDSIRSIAVVAQARQAGLDLAVVDLFRAPTVAGLAAALAARAPTVAADAIELLSAADRALLPDGIEDAYPVSLLQLGMVFHNELDADGGLYHDVFSTSVGLAEWRPALLQRALDALARRHPVLRTSFDLHTGSEPLQRVHAQAQVPLTVVDLGDRDGAAQDAAIAAFVDAERGCRFDLAQAPLLRVFVHVRGPRTIQFTLSFHHAILDGWSVASLQTELFNTYAALLVDADAAPAPPLAIGPRTVVEQERRALQSAPARAYWAQALAGHQYCALPPAEADPTPAHARAAGARLEPALVDALQALASRLGVPLRSVLLAAHLRVLALVSGRSDVTSGLVCNVRPEQAQGDQVLGLFLNTLPLRLAIAGGSWEALVRDTYAAELGVLEHRAYPYFQLHVDNGRVGYFDVVFNFTNFHVYEQLKATSDAPEFRAAFETTGYGLGVNFSFDPGTGLVLEVSPAALSAAQARRIRDHYLAVLAAMAADPGGRHDAAPLLSAADFATVVHSHNPPAAAPAPLLAQQFEAQVRARPDAIALDDGTTTLSYAELNRRANRLARHLVERGVRPDDRVGIACERGIELVVAILGVLKSGAAYLPLDPGYPPARLAYMLDDARPVALLATAATAAAFADRDLPVLVLDADATVAALAREPDDDPDPAALGLAPDHLAYVIYTSGSTGQPKGVLNHHRGLAGLARAQVAAHGVDAGSRVLQFVSISFDVCISEIAMALCAGASLHLAPAAALLPGEPLFATLRARRISHVSLPVAVLATLPTEPALPDLRTLIVGGDVLPPALAAAWHRRCAVFNAYGPTETTVCATVGAFRPEHVDVVPIGAPLAGARLYVLDPWRQPLPPGSTGELWIGGPGVARGYLDRPELTAERFVPDPFAGTPGARMYRSGDLGRWRADGTLEFVGRDDFQVKIRGFRIEPGEIEARLRACAGVRDAAVIARGDGAGDKRLVAYVVADGDAAPSAAQLRAALATTLAEHMLPSAFVHLDALPLTANGKLDRSALPEPDALPRHVEYVAPRDGLEAELCAAWAQVLRLDQVGIHEHFFELGGNSLLVVKLNAMLGARFPGRLSVADFFQHTTVARLADVLRATPAGDDRLPDSAARANARRERLARRATPRGPRATS